MKINEDGSMEGKLFSADSYTGGYPRPKENDTYASYRERVDKAKAEGFNLGDLSWDDWSSYCKGSGSYEGVDAHEKIFSE